MTPLVADRENGKEDEMKWGLFDKRDDGGIIHVVPCSDDGVVLPPHVLESQCPCRPHLDSVADVLLVHAMIQ